MIRQSRWHHFYRSVSLGFLLVLLTGTVSCAHPPIFSEEKTAEAELNFHVQEGRLGNYFYRRGLIATHLVMRSGEEPRIIFAFPAENSGIGLWFKHQAQAVNWQVETPAGVEIEEGMRGIRVQLTADTEQLELEESVLGSVRHLRDYMHSRTKPKLIADEEIKRRGDLLILRRQGLNGKTHYRLQVKPLAGTVIVTDDDGHGFSLKSAGRIAFELTALTDAEPLHPLAIDRLLKKEAIENGNEKSLRLLAFLAYREKFLAGSWRFLTYFGRDSLISARLLMPVLRPEAVEAVLSAVLERLSADGEVAHEEDIGDFAAYRRLTQSQSRSQSQTQPGDLDRPFYDYKMIDDDFMLAPVLQSYFATADGMRRKREFLSRKTSAGITYEEAISRNLKHVLRQAKAFAENPVAANLVKLKDGESVGEWRDSQEGLGGGRIPFNVNAALVPAALAAAEKLLADVDPDLQDQARRFYQVWKSNVLKYFEVRISAAEATRRLAKNGRLLGLEDLVEGQAVSQDVSFPALSLKKNGRPVEIMHSDDSFMLLFLQPNEEYLRSAAERIIQPFPLGLTTPVGMFVANPLFAKDDELVKTFTADHYHGMVTWSWQQAMMAEGLKRQLERPDISDETREVLRRAAEKLWKIIADSREFSTTELWSWKYENGRFHYVPFGGSSSHKTESNAAQLWSTVYLGVKPPADLDR